MRKHTIELLQYRDVCKEISRHCKMEEARSFAENVLPFCDVASITRRKKLALSAFTLLQASIIPPLRYLPPLMSFLEKVDEGASLEIEGIYSVFLYVILVQNLHKWTLSTQKAIGEANDFLGLLTTLPSFDSLYSELSAFMEESGKLKEIASLRAIDREIEKVEVDIKKSMARYFSNEDVMELLQSFLPATKNNRQVLAVKANFKGRIKGIIHEYSQSAKTFYIEPEDIVIKNNQLQELKAEWEREYFRILRHLSNSILEHCSELKTAHSILLEADYSTSLAEWARCNDAHFLMAEGVSLHLKNARHPLIKNCVPINIKMDEKKVLIITGANAGGKTVALKTVALFALMNQSGMPLPLSEESSLPYFDFVACNIGDEQSIASESSTFSAEVRNIAEIINEATARSLVVFDELASGTDIEEGGALAMAILDEMIEKGTLTIVSTHHGALKQYGFANPHCLNASVIFDEETLLPTYQVALGVPGESHALDVAGRNGFSPHLIRRAESYLSEHSSSISHLIKALMQKQSEVDMLEAKLRKDEAVLMNARRECELKSLRLKQKELELKKGSFKSATKMFDEAKKEIENVVRRIVEDGARREDRKAFKDWVRETEETFAKEKSSIDCEEARLKEVDGIPLVTANDKRALQEGDAVYSLTYKKEGVILRLDERDKKALDKKGVDKKKRCALVAFGSLTLTLPLNDLALLEKEAKNTVSKVIYEDDSKLPSARRGGEGTSLFELRILGLRMQEARAVITAHLDQVILNGVTEFSIVHGKGTGVLQELVHEMLGSSPYVKSFSFARPEFGGTGKTLVTMK